MIGSLHPSLRWLPTACVAIAIAAASVVVPAEAQESPAAQPAADATPAAATPAADAPASEPQLPTPTDAPMATTDDNAAEIAPVAAPAPIAEPAAIPAATDGSTVEHPGAAADRNPAGDGPVPDAKHLPHDLSPLNMFLSADLVVKAVMIGLAFASLVTWTVWLAKSIELLWAKRRLERDSGLVAATASLADARKAVGDTRGIVPGLLAMAETELRLSADLTDKAGIKERVVSRLDGMTLAAGRQMNSGTGVLATIGSTAPFVGLFGTVWGIMNSFIGISEAQTTNLAVVAPGIAEALLATAIGLVAAIPAVIIYNQFARSISAYKASVADVSAEVLRLVSRDLDRGVHAPVARAAE